MAAAYENTLKRFKKRLGKSLKNTNLYPALKHLNIVGIGSCILIGHDPVADLGRTQSAILRYLHGLN